MFFDSKSMGWGLGLGLRVWGLRLRIQDLRHHVSTFLVEGGECSVSAWGVLHLQDHQPEAASRQICRQLIMTLEPVENHVTRGFRGTPCRLQTLNPKPWALSHTPYTRSPSLLNLSPKFQHKTPKPQIPKL